MGTERSGFRSWIERASLQPFPGHQDTRRLEDRAAEQHGAELRSSWAARCGPRDEISRTMRPIYRLQTGLRVAG